jgi:hypothetical protein
MVAQLQELLLTPLCGFSQMINKYADGSGGALTYEVHTPKLGLSEVGWKCVQLMFYSWLTQQHVHIQILVCCVVAALAHFHKARMLWPGVMALITSEYADGSGGALTYEAHTPKLGLSELGLTRV